MKEMIIPEETWVKVSRYCDELRELNAELLAALIRAEPWISRDIGVRHRGLARDILDLIAKAEKLK